MKTKHIQYRVGLLIGLLSLNTLSSCVNTAQGLGMGGGSSKNNGKDAERGDNGNSSQAGGKYDKYKEYGKEALKYGGSFAVGYGTKAAVDAAANYWSQSGSTGSHNSGYNTTGSHNTGYGWGMDTPNR
ncbi:MAG: hypothetical protein NMK33_01785 [Candidatus Cardinium sp.]|uniref:hypothetical protein n=1 Tax=Cardinium endosymbiont of Dermatophagoides farinae TaxID=2597823 RepID=UPI00118456BC|nr:hypothetical protein [Cardinium endosymbiont of Dermatophagoides farinae]TSJ81223.1 hypothetical protein FPG78_04470 [Cardinium endosymbiont of Dermatophagoides farinae]UWW97273.1 MAG: hypothetical protein NMK33_01785 [Candidatus Cardinium sp.]